MAAYFAVGLSVGYFCYDDIAVGLQVLLPCAGQFLKETMKGCSKMCTKRKIKQVPSLDSTFAHIASTVAESISTPQYNPISELVESTVCCEPAETAACAVVAGENAEVTNATDVGEVTEVEASQLDQHDADAKKVD